MMIFGRGGIITLQDERPGERDGLDAHYLKIGPDAWVKVAPARVRWLDAETCTIAAPDAALEAELDRGLERTGERLWRVRPRGFFDRAASLLRAVTSGTLDAGEPVDAETLRVRRASCASCPVMVKDEHGAFCNACGCGRWQLANLDGTALPKLAWKTLECPLGRPGFSNAPPA